MMNMNNKNSRTVVMSSVGFLTKNGALEMLVKWHIFSYPSESPTVYINMQFSVSGLHMFLMIPLQRSCLTSCNVIRRQMTVNDVLLTPQVSQAYM